MAGRTRTRSSRLVVGIDTGGTFTDVVFRDGSRTGTYKLLSTPDDPARAVLTALGTLFGTRRADRITYGTTVATNAMLERRGARTALLTTEGFEDVLEIGRQARPSLYDLEPAKPAPLVPRRLRLGVAERSHYDGTVERPLAQRELVRLKRRLAELRVESVAVCLLHAYANPRHEVSIADALKPLGVPVTLSHQLSPEPAEYERTNTAVANAYVQPLVGRHLRELATRSRARAFRVMQSNGGAIGHETACREPIRTMLSGPAGGVAAAFERARANGSASAITFDMGGTSTDVAFVENGVPRRSLTSIEGLPIRTPCVDIHTVGAGGGSIAEIDPGGSLKVGPESAGADPGPACYGTGRRPTVTDANVVLGRLRPEAFLGGSMALDLGRARKALVPIAKAMHATVERAAEGIVRVVEGAMERAIRVITVERGHDPRASTLVAYGGAAGLHACGLAEALDVRRILVPADPGLLSAWGVIDGPVVRDHTAAFRLVDPTVAELRVRAKQLETRARNELRREGFADRRIRVEPFVRIRYLGQSLLLEVPLGRTYRTGFDRLHEQLFMTSTPDRPVEVCGLRVTTSGSEPAAGARMRTRGPGLPRRRPTRTVTIWLDGRTRPVRHYDRRTLRAGDVITGPAIVTEYSSTALIDRGWVATVGASSDMTLERSHD